jgi:hypothetical protein
MLCALFAVFFVMDFFFLPRNYFGRNFKTKCVEDKDSNSRSELSITERNNLTWQRL